MSSKFRKSYDNTWSIRNPSINISKDEIRNVVKEVGEKYGLGYIFGTPLNWDFEGPIIEVGISNLHHTEADKKQFKRFVAEVKSEYEKISGKNISISAVKRHREYEEYGVSKIEYLEIVLKVKFN